MRKQLYGRVLESEYEAAISAAQKITRFANHAQIAEAIIKHLRKSEPETVSALIRVACGLTTSPEPTEYEKVDWNIRVRVRDESEENVVADFLKNYSHRRNLAADIAGRLRDRAPLLHPSEL